MGVRSGRGGAQSLACLLALGHQEVCRALADAHGRRAARPRAQGSLLSERELPEHAGQSGSELALAGFCVLILKSIEVKARHGYGTEVKQGAPRALGTGGMREITGVLT